METKRTDLRERGVLRLGTISKALLIAAVLAGTSGAALAASHDGKWSMTADTTRGHCGSIAVGLTIHRGRIHSTSGSFAFHPIRLGGSVSASGQARMSAITGPRKAAGTGRFTSQKGSGTWRGIGPSGVCSGVWTAERLG